MPISIIKKWVHIVAKRMFLKSIAWGNCFHECWHISISIIFWLWSLALIRILVLIGWNFGEFCLKERKGEFHLGFAFTTFCLQVWTFIKISKPDHEVIKNNMDIVGRNNSKILSHQSCGNFQSKNLTVIAHPATGLSFCHLLNCPLK